MSNCSETPLTGVQALSLRALYFLSVMETIQDDMIGDLGLMKQESLNMDLDARDKMPN